MNTSTLSQPAAPPPPPKDFAGRVDRFWQRVTDGLALNQLWSQFRTDARTSYRMYSREVDPTREEGVRKGRHYFNLAKQFFWAILEKLSPARRVLLLLALVLIVFNPEVSWTASGGARETLNLDLAALGGLLMFVLLIMEVTDRVVMKRDLQIAREIQMWLLPSHPPQVPGLEIAFGTRPANTVAGDYYDVFARPSGGEAKKTFLITVADVAGKSIPAALLMATFQASLKTLSSTRCSLAQLVDGMNHYACSNSQDGLRFTTAFVGEYDAANRTLIYINAGHNAPMLRHASGSVERLDVGGLPLGIQSDARFGDSVVKLEAGDWLAIFTDGLVEASNDREEEYGEERLISALQAGAALPPQQVLSRVMVDLDAFIGNAPQHDDVTCMLLRAS